MLAEGLEHSPDVVELLKAHQRAEAWKEEVERCFRSDLVIRTLLPLIFPYFCSPLSVPESRLFWHLLARGNYFRPDLIIRTLIPLFFPFLLFNECSRLFRRLLGGVVENSGSPWAFSGKYCLQFHTHLFIKKNFLCICIQNRGHANGVFSLLGIVEKTLSNSSPIKPTY